MEKENYSKKTIFIITKANLIMIKNKVKDKKKKMATFTQDNFLIIKNRERVV